MVLLLLLLIMIMMIIANYTYTYTCNHGYMHTHILKLTLSVMLCNMYGVDEVRGRALPARAWASLELCCCFLFVVSNKL